MRSESHYADPDKIDVLGRRGGVVALAALLAGALISGFAIRFPALYGIDDAQITQVYGRNIAEGLGYVFYAGGERVEGSTSLLWTLVNALAYLTPAPRIVLFSSCLALTFLTLLGMLRIVVAFARPAQQLPAAIGASLALTSLDLNFHVWSIWSFMDHGLYICVVTAVVVAAMRLDRPLPADRDKAVLLALLALLAITRPEGIAVSAALTLSLALLSWLSGRRSLAFVLLAGAAVAAGSFAAATAFRMTYFGYPFPNTFYAKVSLDLVSTLTRGAAYTARAFLGTPLLPLGVMLGGWLAFGCIRKALAGRTLAGFHKEVALLSTCAAVLLTTVLEGGDHFAGARLLQPIAPAAAALVGVAAARLLSRSALTQTRTGAAAALIGGLVLCAGAALYYPHSRQTLRAEFDVGEEARQVGRRMNEINARFGPASIGVIVAGGTPMEFRGKVYDIEGLNWPEMAHADKVKSGPAGHDSFNAQVLYRNVPDVLHLLQQDPAAPRVASFTTAASKDVASDSRFRALYVPVVFTLSDGPFVTFASRAWLVHARPGPVAMIDWDRVKIER